MTETERLLETLKFARSFSLQMLDEFETDEQWLTRPHEHSNHALWFMGHMGNSDNFLIGLLDPDRAVNNEQMKKLFGAGSQPTEDPADYPPVSEVRAWLEDRRAVLMELARTLTDDDLARPTPDSAPRFIPTVGAALGFMAWHEGLHAGQITVVHRQLGHQPISSRPKKEPSRA